MKEYRELYWPTYKADYQLIPKADEELWYKRVEENKREMKIIDPSVKMPVILKVGDEVPSLDSHIF